MPTPEKRARDTVLPSDGREALRTARRRLQPRLWPIIQTAAAAVAAWYLAVLVLGTQRPVFASIAAVICVGATIGQRRERAVELIGGVVVGIAVADLLVRLIGTGPPQIGVMIVLAMVAAVLLGGGPLLVSEAGVSALLLAALQPAGSTFPPSRFLEALIGGSVALVVSSFLFPPNPTLLAARAAQSLFGELGEALAEVAAALADGDPGRAERALQAARSVDDRFDRLDDALATGRDTARLAPTQRAARAELDRYTQTLTQLDFAVRDTRVLARHALRYVRRSGQAPDGLPDAVRDLGFAVWALAAPGEPTDRRDEVGELARAATVRATAISESHPDRRVAEIAGQVLSTAVDLIRASAAAGDAGTTGTSPTEELLAEPYRAAGQPPAPASDDR
ncbi:MAG: aromatic acid exporter family protein [Actinobacteria bacterium]|nr:MAG: aromatic acid exporter family protein [Actinomycetota bacterium]